MAVSKSQFTATAAGSAGSAVGSASSPGIVEGTVLAVNLRLVYKVAFTSGSVKPQRGDTLSGATGGATARVWDVVLTSGTWAGGDAAGTLWLTDQSGTFESENLDNDTTGVANVATIAADTTAPASTIDVTIQEGNEWPPLPVLTVANLAVDAWYYPRVTLHDVADGAAIVGPVDYQTVADYLSLALTGANDDDSILATIYWDDLR